MECRQCFYLFVDIPAVSMPFLFPKLTPLSFGIPCGANFVCISPDYLPSGSSILWHYVFQIDSPVFWHPVRCKLRLHLARLSAVRVVDIVALCSPIFSVKVAVAYGFGNVL